jgi:hypothetical protein
MMVGDDLHQDLDQDKIDGILPALANESLVNRGDDQR